MFAAREKARIAIPLACYLLLTAPSSSQSTGSPSTKSSSPQSNQTYIQDCSPGISRSRDCLFIQKIYAQRLVDLKESPLLLSQHIDPETYLYRLTVLSPTSHTTAQMIRVFIKTDSITEATFKSSGQFGTLKASKAFSISQAHTQALLNVLNWSSFSKMNSIDTEDSNRNLRDGQLWLIEGVHNGQYHAVHISNPEHGDLFEAGNLLVKLANSYVNP